MIEVIGNGCVARILADSISEAGVGLTTMEIECPRIIWAEFLTHGMLPRNAASSRAIPFNKMQEQLTAKPVRFGAANKGMQDGGAHTLFVKGQEKFDIYTGEDYETYYTPEEAWQLAKEDAQFWSKAYYEAGYAKQVYNRLTEPYQTIKAVVSATEWANYFWLRNDIAADPTLEELAKTMYAAKEQSNPELLKAGDWHLPYISIATNKWHARAYYPDGACSRELEMSAEEAIKMSAARTAAVSFRNEDYTLAKSLEVYDRLIGDERKHASAFQHQATPMQSQLIVQSGFDSINVPKWPNTWEPGVSHVDRDGQLWSAQFRGWVMNRKLIPGENYVDSSK